uniref:NADH dehydrogenase subunit 5 n=1 Tax=Cordax unidentatus TaxID=3021430 RepID=UPI0030FE819B|nr:NADH dehydrogenase subunit 5 [Cordax unidentatus]
MKDMYTQLGRLSGLILLGGSGLSIMGASNWFLHGGGLSIEWGILNFNSANVVFLIYMDWMACVFMGAVMFISGWVLIYSDFYMEGDSYLNRFVGLVLLFVLSMVFLILSPNLLSMLLGWDGLGLVSYCLVIYYQSSKAYNAGMLTALTNRVGDVMLLMGGAWWLSQGGWNYIYYGTAMNFDTTTVTVVSGLVVVAAMTKSAQIPFSAWLPAAMAAPTPVSSLVHSSTLVTAGVYLLVRFHGALTEASKGGLLLIACLTMFMAGLGANFEMDLKKIVALSTLSQLGLMMATLGLGYPIVAFFHLVTHALFKALLFMCAGNYIHTLGDNQDIRWMGGASGQMPLTTACFVLANLALCGFPFLAGFYSKDLILETAFLTPANWVGLVLIFLATGLTVAYSVRLAGVALVAPFKGKGFSNWGDTNWGILIPMMALAAMAVTGGSLMVWEILPTPAVVILPKGLKLFTLVVIGGGAVLGGWVGSWGSNMRSQTLDALEGRGFVGDMWFLPGISTLGLSGYPLKWGGLYFFCWDQGWSEAGGGQGLMDILAKAAYFQETWGSAAPLSILLGTLVAGVWTYAVMM